MPLLLYFQLVSWSQYRPSCPYIESRPLILSHQSPWTQSYTLSAGKRSLIRSHHRVSTRPGCVTDSRVSGPLPSNIRPTLNFIPFTALLDADTTVYDMKTGPILSAAARGTLRARAATFFALTSIAVIPFGTRSRFSVTTFRCKLRM